MQIYLVKPNPGIMSRHWQVDECGLKYIENYYTFYNGRNRWHEFNLESTEPFISIDFGGAAFMDEPMIEFEVLGVTFRFLSHQAIGVHDCVKGDTYKDSDIWRIDGRWLNSAIGKDLRDAFLEVSNDKVDSWNEQFIDYFNMWKLKHRPGAIN